MKRSRHGNPARRHDSAIFRHLARNIGGGCGLGPIGVWICLALLTCGCQDRAEPKIDAPPKNLVNRSPAVDTPQTSSGAPASPTPLPCDFTNADPTVAYIGSDACAACHKNRFASYMRSAHSRSMALVDALSQPPDGTYFHPPSAVTYAAFRRDDHLIHQESSQLGERSHVWAEHPLKYLVGSGRFARTYLIERDGILFESPLSWFESSRQWALSPGFESDRQPTFSRSIPVGCLDCHAGDFERDSRKVGDLTVHEAAIGCERCHGAGQLHQSKWMAKTPAPNDAEASGKDLTIVNPSHLSRDLINDICAKCHLQGAASVNVRGQRSRDYRPGMRLRDFVTHFHIEPATKSMAVVGHVEQMRNSPCYQRSDTLSCISCHDPHQDTPPENKVEYYRASCLQCHQNEDCGEPLNERQSLCQNDCTHCHMPQSPTDVTHVAFTHHRIGIHPPGSSRSSEEQTAGLRLVEFDIAEQQSALDRKRAAALANIEVFWSHMNNSEFLPMGDRGVTLLNDLLAADFVDPQVALALATLATTDGKPAMAIRLASIGLSRQPTLTVEIKLLMLIGESYLMTEEFKKAKPIYQRLTSLRDDAEDWFRLGLCEITLNNTAASIIAVQQARRLNPSHEDSLQAIVDLYESTGQREQAKPLLQLLEAINSQGKQD